MQNAAQHDDPHPTHQLDDLVHQRTRLGIPAVASEGGQVTFGFLQETLGLSDGNLSRHVSNLEDTGLLKVEKGYEGKRPRTWVHITKASNKAMAHEIAQLKNLISRLEPSPGQDPG
jgi:DNA-binding MarR family transcriptional regulator